MKVLTQKLLASAMLAISSMAYAASDSTTVDIQVIHIEYLNFIGTAVGTLDICPGNGYAIESMGRKKFPEVEFTVKFNSAIL